MLIDFRRYFSRKSRRLDFQASMVAIILMTSAVHTGSPTLAQDWKHDWVALTIDIAGNWGAATNRSRAHAIALAIRDCKRRAENKQVSCGALVSTTRAAWSLAYLCNQVPFIVTGNTLAIARRLAIARELSIYFDGKAGADACRLVVGFDPSGRAMEREMRNAIVPLIPESSE
jgi:hypothetical protein